MPRKVKYKARKESDYKKLTNEENAISIIKSIN